MDLPDMADIDIERQLDSGEDSFTMQEWNGIADSPRNNGRTDSRFTALNNVVFRPGIGCVGLARPDFEGCQELLNFMRTDCKILVVGAGGLGCELLKNLALLGFGQLSVIDMDTIDLSNLNRQFLFRCSDIGKSKAECAAAFINNRIPHCQVTAYFNKIEDFDSEFYRQFRVVVCGLDSVVARRWINGMLVSMLSYDDEGNLDQSSIIPLVDGGTEGFKGNIRVVTPGISACLECSVDLYPPQVNYPMCTIAHTPRLPEHCIEYVKVLVWPKEEPFGAGVAVDGDDPEHITWILQKAEERAKEFSIPGVTYRLTLGVVKHIIPAVASTNAIIASACATEVLKAATSLYYALDNFFSFNDSDGIYTHAFRMERNENCLACSEKPQIIHVNFSHSLRNLIDMLKESPKYQMGNPGVTWLIEEGKQRILYMSSVASLKEQTKENLAKSLDTLGLKEGDNLLVLDLTQPTGKIFTLRSI